MIVKTTKEIIEKYRMWGLVIREGLIKQPNKEWVSVDSLKKEYVPKIEVAKLKFQIINHIRDDLLLSNSLLKEVNPLIHVVRGTLFNDISILFNDLVGDVDFFPNLSDKGVFGEATKTKKKKEVRK